VSSLHRARTNDSARKHVSELIAKSTHKRLNTWVREWAHCTEHAQTTQHVSTWVSSLHRARTNDLTLKHVSELIAQSTHKQLKSVRNYAPAWDDTVQSLCGQRSAEGSAQTCWGAVTRPWMICPAVWSTMKASVSMTEHSTATGLQHELKAGGWQATCISTSHTLRVLHVLDPNLHVILNVTGISVFVWSFRGKLR